jgi:hypothetical protein
LSTYQQILAGTSVSITETFSVDGTAINVDSGLPTLTLTRPDGTAYTPVPTVLNSWAGPPARAVGEYRFVLTAQQDPYYLDYTLTGTIGGQPQTLRGRVEWVGEQLFTLAEMRKMRVPGGTPFENLTTYPNADIQQVRSDVLDEFTEILGYSPVPRFYREVHSVRSWADVVLKEKKFQRLLTVKVSGVAQTVGNFYVDPGGALLPVTNYLAGTWSGYGYGNVAVEYVAGLDRVPGRGRHAAMLMAGAALNPAGFSTAQTVSMPTGETYTYEPTETSRGGFQRHTGVRELDRWLNRWAPPRIGVA